MSEIIQRTPEWFAAKLGKATASCIADVVAKTKTGYSASRANYAARLIAERLTGVAAETYQNAAMQYGTQLEPEARIAYEFHADCEVVEVGFVQHSKIPMAGASPDGFVGDDGLVEIKCPTVATHIDTLLGAAIDGKYVTQIQFQMACTGRKWCDFVSYDVRLPEPMRLFVQRVNRDDRRIAELEAEVVRFLGEIDQKVAALKTRYALQEAA